MILGKIPQERLELFHGNEEMSVEVDGACMHVHGCRVLGMWGRQGRCKANAGRLSFYICKVIWKSLMHSEPKSPTLSLLLKMFYNQVSLL